MKEFKGTKVFPKYEGGDNYSIDMIFESGAAISIDRRDRYSDKLVMSREEMEANAKLIESAPGMFEMLQKAKSTISRLKNSMRAHPDCEENSEFSDYVELAEQQEYKIEQLLTKITE